MAIIGFDRPEKPTVDHAVRFRTVMAATVLGQKVSAASTQVAINGSNERQSSLDGTKCPSPFPAMGFSRVLLMLCGRFVFPLDLSKNPIEIGGAVSCTIATG
jgi:hypothetical protein